MANISYLKKLVVGYEPVIKKMSKKKIND